uniref:Uncharacterized protein n=1 Tax=Desulfovibrio sp. U5L TaxID=596152 RepID=I2Q3D1_9BACT
MAGATAARHQGSRFLQSPANASDPRDETVRRDRLSCGLPDSVLASADTHSVFMLLPGTEKLPADCDNASMPAAIQKMAFLFILYVIIIFKQFQNYFD